jgi:uncharacterized protein
LDLHVTFPISGVSTHVLLPPSVAFIVSFLASMGGVSGAFLLLPFQISFLHFLSPSVSATNFVYNVVAIPSGVYRYVREKRMAWPLTWIIIAGTLPGVLLGYFIRVLYLPNPRSFRLFVGCVLLYVGLRLVQELYSGRKNKGNRYGNGIKAPAVVRTISFSAKTVEYEFCEERFSFGTIRMLIMAFVVGTVGGIYGIGGGSIISPFCVTVFALPVYTVAGAALFGTFLTSIAGVVFYSTISIKPGVSTAPDWALGILFGLGGLLGMYCGARAQRFVPQSLIKAMMGIMMLFLASTYIIEYFMG